MSKQIVFLLLMEGQVTKVRFRGTKSNTNISTGNNQNTPKTTLLSPSTPNPPKTSENLLWYPLAPYTFPLSFTTHSWTTLKLKILITYLLNVKFMAKRRLKKEELFNEILPTWGWRCWINVTEIDSTLLLKEVAHSLSFVFEKQRFNQSQQILRGSSNIVIGVSIFFDKKNTDLKTLQNVLVLYIYTLYLLFQILPWCNLGVPKQKWMQLLKQGEKGN